MAAQPHPARHAHVGQCLTAGLTGIVVLISDVIFGAVAAAVVGVASAVGVSALWFGLPLYRRGHE